MSINPVTYARITKGFSKNRLAKELEIDKAYLSRTEDGCYTSPGSTLTAFTAATLQIDPETVLDRYKDFQHRKRMVTVSLTAGLEPIKPVNNQLIHTLFKNWRERYWTTVTSFCNSMCFHPAVLADFENGKYTEMPSGLFDILDAFDLIDDTVDLKVKDDKRRHNRFHKQPERAAKSK